MVGRACGHGAVYQQGYASRAAILAERRKAQA